MKICSTGTCSQLAAPKSNRCERHSKRRVLRKSASKRGYGAKHRKIRNQILTRDDYTCHDCGHWGNEVHHVRKLRDAPGAAHDPHNLITLCKSCHSQRTKRGE